MIIAGAGGAAHLPGMLAAITILPVLGVPVESKVAPGGRFAAVDRPDAAGRAGGDAGDRRVGRGQRGAAGRGDPGAEAIPTIREALAAFRQAQTDAVGESPMMSRADGRTDRGRPPLYPPASLGVIGGGQLGRMFVQAAQRMGYRAGVLEPRPRRPGRAGRPLVGRRPARSPPAPPRLADQADGGHRRVRERLGPRAALAGRGAMPVRPGWRTRLGQPEPTAGEDVPGPARHPPRPLAAGADRRRAGRGGRGARAFP